MPKQQAVELYGIVNCDSVKKARAWLAAAGREVQFHDFKKEPPSKALIEQWLKHLPWDELVNRRGTTWRLLAEDQRPTSKTAAIGAVLERPTLIKRPVVCFGNQLLVGFDPDLYQKTFG
jgi:Spx/MgsR family transcriptional regulator